MKNYLFIICTTILLVSCQTAKQAEENKQFERKLTYIVESDVQSDPDGCTYLVESSNEISFTEILMIKKSLSANGHKVVGNSKDVVCTVTPKFEMEKPKLGIAVGLINPYKHTLTLTALRNKKIVWKTSIQGPSEYEKRGDVVAKLLGAAKGYVGQSSLGEKRIELHDSSPAVLEILNGIKNN